MDNLPSTEELGRAAASTRSVLERVRHEQLGAPTPCASWDVRALVNHFVGVPGRVGAVLTGEEVEDHADVTSGDVLASYDEALARARRGFETPGAMERRVPTPFGEVPGAILLGMVTADQFVHGWDLARATGQPTDLDPELASRLLVRAQASITEAFRGEDGKAPFGPVVEPPEGASPADRLVAFYGRALL